MGFRLPVAATRVFRLGLTTALTLACAYALDVPLPFIAPILAFALGIKPAPPIPLKQSIALLIGLGMITGSGLLLLPILTQYTAAGLAIIALGLFVANYISVQLGKGAVGSLLTVGLTLITAAGYGSFQTGRMVVEALILGMALALVCQRIVYPLLPEPAGTAPAPAAPPQSPDNAKWIALRATLIVYPTFLLGLFNPSAYLPIIMKAVSLGQQTTLTSAKSAGRELLGSTIMGGLFAIGFWFSLGVMTNLWMFFLCMLASASYFAAKIYRIFPTSYSPGFWVNTCITMLILLGPAVQDTASGKDVYKAFAVRISLFIAVTLYAWLALHALESLRQWQQLRAAKTATPC